MRRLLFLLALALAAAACAPSTGAETTGEPSEPAAGATTGSAPSPPLSADEKVFGATPEQVALLTLPVGSPLPAISRSFDVEIADFDGEGHDDILFTRHQNLKISSDDPDGLWVWSPGGYELMFLLPMMEDRHGCAGGDVIGVGLRDAYCQIGGFRGSTRIKTNELWIQTAPGEFENQAATWGVDDPYGRGRWPVMFDFDNDGLLDLYVTNETDREDGRRSENMLFRNVGGRFEEIRTAITGELGHDCLHAVDLEGDGWTDVVLCDNQGRLQLFSNQEGNDFVDATGEMLDNDQRWKDVAFGDLDGDGAVDMALVGKKRAQLRLNKGPGQWFTNVKKKVVLKDLGWSVTIGDFLESDDPDIYLVQQGIDCVDLGSRAQNGQDWVLVGPKWKKVAVGNLRLGCGNEAETLDGKLVLVVNGVERTRGPVQVLDLREDS